MKSIEDFKNKIICGDALEVLKEIPDESIDLVLTDPPYNITACKWDKKIDLDKLWQELIRISKDKTAIIFTASQPFTSILVMSNLKMFKHEWIWQKAVGSNFATLKYQPMKEHESILVFCKSSPNYYPQLETRKGSGKKRSQYQYKSNTISGEVINKLKTNRKGEKYDENKRFPSSVQFFNNREKDRGLHPTQKPVALLSYLIKTYSSENDLVLDPFIGSGTTAVACKQLNRNYIGIEISKDYCKLAQQRIKEIEQNLKLF